MSQAMGDRLGEAMEEHYRTFIVSQELFAHAVSLTTDMSSDGTRYRRNCW